MKISVAVCDDLEEERLQMARMLKNYGRRNGVSWNIELLESGDAFLEVFQPGRWDIVLMDIYMDGLNGMEAAPPPARPGQRMHPDFCHHQYGARDCQL